MLVRPFADEDEDSSDEGESNDRQEPGYTFAGFTIEFSEKVMLTPVAPDRSRLAKVQAEA